MLPENIQVKTESVQNIANSIRGKNGSTDKYKIGEMSGAIDELIVAQPNTTKEITENGTYDVSTYTSANVQTPVPTGTKEITQNGTTSVKDYEFANVQVPQPTGTITITQNGTTNVNDYQYADVQVPQPSGSTTITTNGTHDVTNYASADVNVPMPIAFDKLCFQATQLSSQSSVNSFMTFLSKIDWSQIKICDSMFKSVYLSSSGSNYVPFTFTFPSSFKPSSCVGMFNSARVTGIPLFDTSLVTSMQSFCYTANYIVDVPKFNTTSITTATGVQNMFYQCSQLSQQSVDNVLQMCIDLSSKFTGSLGYLWNHNLPTTISDKAQNSSYYQAFLDSGWTL